MAVLLDSHPLGTWVNVGTLARMPLAGGAPRERGRAGAVGGLGAGWHQSWPSCAMSAAGTAWSIPVGKVLYETGGWISHPRVSPKGDMIAFLDHPVQGDDSGSVAVVDLTGKKKTLTGELVQHAGTGVVAGWQGSVVYRQQDAEPTGRCTR